MNFIKEYIYPYIEAIIDKIRHMSKWIIAIFIAGIIIFIMFYHKEINDNNVITKEVVTQKRNTIAEQSLQKNKAKLSITDMPVPLSASGISGPISVPVNVLTGINNITRSLPIPVIMGASDFTTKSGYILITDNGMKHLGLDGTGTLRRTINAFMNGRLSETNTLQYAGFTFTFDKNLIITNGVIPGPVDKEKFDKLTTLYIQLSQALANKKDTTVGNTVIKYEDLREKVIETKDTLTNMSKNRQPTETNQFNGHSILEIAREFHLN